MQSNGNLLFRIFGKKLAMKKKNGAAIGVIIILLIIVASGSTSRPATQPAKTGANPTPTQSQQITPVSTGGVFVKVTNVVDGDTIKIETGETVRYIGIDTPEMVHPSKPLQCYGKEASDKNTALVEGKIVELEKDVSQTDKYGRLLRYIWLDGILVNEVLVREGYAFSSTYPPDVKYQERFIAAQKLAQEEQKGLWSNACTITPTKAAVKGATDRKKEESKNTDMGTYQCNCNKPCAQMSSCAEAQYQLTSCGCSKRDADGDGIACDSDCQ